jgi:hypothetical protein
MVVSIGLDLDAAEFMQCTKEMLNPISWHENSKVIRMTKKIQ